MAPGTQETTFQKSTKSKRSPYVGMAAALILGMLFLYSGIYSVMCGSFVIGIFLYIIPKSFGADWKKLAAFGVIFLVAGSMFGAYAVTKPAFLGQEEKQDAGDFRGVYVTPSGGSSEFYAEYDLGEGQRIEMKLWESEMIYMGSVVPKGDARTVTAISEESPHRFITDLEDGKIYIYRFAVLDADSKAVKESAVFMGPITAGDSSFTMSCITGNLYFVGVYIMLIFYLILLFTTWMRSSLEKTRARLEAEGRLYPRGYGRCKTCGSLVLPGEVVCRKCGEYIDVPDEFKPKKVDYFVCSECGREVPADADACPSCGESFDDEETEIFTLPDNSERGGNRRGGSGNESGEGGTPKGRSGEDKVQKFVCSKCGSRVPADADTCPACGEEFE